MKWLEIVVTLLILLTIVVFINKVDTSRFYEGFTQSKPFTLKMDENVYDNFYVEIYDDIHNREELSKKDYERVLETTMPNKESYILDVGSGTGGMLNALTENGYNSCGVDKSESMVKKSKEKYPNIEVNHKDVTNSIIFDRGTFTHICCMDFTFYEINDKEKFLKNSNYWLKPNGYLILHLVEREKYNPIVEGANPLLNDNPQEYLDKRLEKAKINFIDFEYNQHMIFNEKTNDVLFKESFCDSITKNIRQNERLMKMDNIDEIIKVCRRCGFIVKGQYGFLNDKWQFIYILEKQL